jgi:sugar phosphate isomerase/epimerase
MLTQTPANTLMFPATLAFVNPHISRRSFLGVSVALAGALRLGAADPAFPFPTDVPHRLSVSTYPFRSVIAKTGKLTLPEFAATVVDKFGVYGIEPWSRHFDSIEPTYVHSLRDAFDKAKLQVVNIPCDVNVRPCGTPEQQTFAQETWRKWIDGAVILNSPGIRIHVEPAKTGDFMPLAVDALKRISDYSSQKNIVMNVENDSPKSEDPALILSILEKVGSPWVRSLPDFCNSMQIHDDQDYNAKALASLFPYAYNISHVKDVEIVGGKSLTVDVDRIFKIATAANYKGFFSMETEGSLDPYVGSRKLIAAALKNLQS